MKAGIQERQGILGDALSCALALENAAWSEIEFENLTYEDLSEVYCHAVQWTDGMLRQL